MKLRHYRVHAIVEGKITRKGHTLPTLSVKFYLDLPVGIDPQASARYVIRESFPRRAFTIGDVESLFTDDE